MISQVLRSIIISIAMELDPSPAKIFATTGTTTVALKVRTIFEIYLLGS